MNRKIRWITETALLLSLLVTLQAATRGFGQMVTGSCVNAVLTVAALVGGCGCGVTVALISPVLAYLLGIAPQILVVPAIMVGNTVFVVVLHGISGKESRPVWKQIAAWLAAATAKFAALCGIVRGVLCGLLAEPLLASGALKPPMLSALPAMFGFPQLLTALIGGGVALLIVPMLRKALRR